MSDPASTTGARGRSRPGKAGGSRELAYKLAYEEGMRTVDDQVAELDSMRQRSVQFLAFVGAATAFLVGTGVNRNGDNRDGAFYLLSSFATVASVLSILAVTMILLSLRVFARDFVDDAPTGVAQAQSKSIRWVQKMAYQFRLSPGALVEWVEPEVPEPTDGDLYKNLAIYYEKMQGWNESRLRSVRRTYVFFLVLGFLQVILWSAVAWHNG